MMSNYRAQFCKPTNNHTPCGNGNVNCLCSHYMNTETHPFFKCKLEIEFEKQMGKLCGDCLQAMKEAKDRIAV